MKLDECAFFFCMTIAASGIGYAAALADEPKPDPVAAENVMLKNKLSVTENMMTEAQNARRDWEISARQLDAVATDLKAQLAKAKAACPPPAAEPPK